MLGDKAFFSFTSVTDGSKHVAYNEWHQLDHRPENLLLDGVRYGERWVLSPDCAGCGHCADPRLGAIHYVNMYWLRPPAPMSIAEWQALAERSFQWGRRPEIAWATRPLMGFFTPVKGYASRRVRVSADALPFRPNRGVHLQLSRLSDPHGARTGELFAWYDQIRIPELLEEDGVAGVWTFSSDSTTLDPSWEEVAGSMTFNAAGSDQGRLRLVLTFLDGDPVEVAPRLASRGDEQSGAGGGTSSEPVESIVFAAPLRSILPWQWDWFDKPG